MNQIQKKLEEALTGRFKLAAALQKREQERRAKDEARAAREKQPQQPVKETVEPIDEISTKALQSYRQAAHTQIQHSKFGAGKNKPKAGDVIAKREKGMASATAKVIAKDAANRKPMTPQKTTPYKPLGGRDEKSGRSYSESVEQMNELSKGISVKEENFKQFRASLIEKTLTPAEMKKREEVAKAIEREKPNMPMGMKMAIATKTAKRVAEEVDDEGKMAKGQLMRMVNQASALAQMMDDDKQLDGWVQSKLTMASDYLDSVHDYLMHNKQDVDEMEEEVKDEYARKVDKYLKKKYNKEETVVETKGAPKGFHFTRDGKLKRGDANQDGDGGPMLRSDPLDKQRNKIPAVSEAPEGEHLCAKHVYSDMFGEGVVMDSLHAEPDEQGNIEWYAVQFDEGIKKVFTEKIQIMTASYHGNHKKKRMTNG